MNTIVKIITLGAFLTVILSFGGRWSPLLDSLAVIRPIAWIVALIGAWMFVGWQRIALLVALTILAIPFFALRPIAKRLEDAQVTVFQHNLLFNNTAPDLALIAEQLHPDIMALQEIKAARPSINGLTDYPYRYVCKFEAIGDTGIIARHEAIKNGCATGENRGFAWAQFDLDGELITVVSLHLHWPFPYGQAEQVADLQMQLADLPQPIIVAGDFNQMPWSYSVRSIADAVDGEIVGGLRLTLIRFPFYLPIDHAIFPKGEVSARRLDRYGSDHNAVYYRWKPSGD